MLWGGGVYACVCTKCVAGFIVLFLQLLCFAPVAKELLSSNMQLSFKPLDLYLADSLVQLPA